MVLYVSLQRLDGQTEKNAKEVLKQKEKQKSMKNSLCTQQKQI